MLDKILIKCKNRLRLNKENKMLTYIVLIVAICFVALFK